MKFSDLCTSLFTSSAPARAKNGAIVVGFLGSFICIFILELLSHYSPWLWVMAPFGASCVLVFALPASPLAQPRHVIGGHLCTALVGLGILSLFGHSMLAIACAVALGIAAMQWLRVIHPPAGANPLVIMMLQPHWDFVLFPVLSGAVIVVLVGIVIHRLCASLHPTPYPQYWW